MKRKITGMLLMCLLSGDAHVFAAERASGVLESAVAREAARVARLEASAAQASGTPAKQHTGHPVLIGAAIGAAALGIAAYATASCSVPPPNDEAACGSHYKGGSAVLGAGIGAGVGALIGLAFRH
ncbi:MAG TPA: hypothetical protein VMS40_21910 [Vicinamibacterales bacterium]|nr:hypothetical protein [Vicinamibacterales bacterium]